MKEVWTEVTFVTMLFQKGNKIEKTKREITILTKTNQVSIMSLKFGCRTLTLAPKEW